MYRISGKQLVAIAMTSALFAVVILVLAQRVFQRTDRSPATFGAGRSASLFKCRNVPGALVELRQRGGRGYSPVRRAVPGRHGGNLDRLAARDQRGISPF